MHSELTLGAELTLLFRRLLLLLVLVIVLSLVSLVIVEIGANRLEEVVLVRDAMHILRTSLHPCIVLHLWLLQYGVLFQCHWHI